MVRTMSFTELARRPAVRHQFTPKVAPRPISPVDRQFKQMFWNLLDLRRPRKWSFSFRPSALPFCSWEAVLAELVGSDGPDQTESFERDYYTSVGHTVHEVMQRWLGRAGYLYGPYQCSQCRLTEVSQGTPKACSQGCANPAWRYLEIDLMAADPTGLLASAKADGLVHFEWMEPSHYYLVDFKTCALYTLPQPEYGITSSFHKKYLIQTAIYAHLLSRSDDIVIDGTVVIFVPRDDPKQMTAVVVDQSEEHGAVYRDVIRQIRHVRRALRDRKVGHIKKKCTKQSDGVDCPFQTICFDPDRTAALFATHGVDASQTTA